jgi:exodeoxyribonuclease V alpha subunit
MRNYESIKGQIIKVIFSNTDAKYAVIRVQNAAGSNIFNAAGRIESPKVGAIVVLNGYFENHRKHGIQFKTVNSEIAVPDTLAGLTKYLGAGFVESVGSQSASNIVEYFGDETINILENDIDKLILVPGIGPVKIRNIKLAWNDQKQFNVMIKKKLLP